MSKSNLQSLKSKNAVTITKLHADVKKRRAMARGAFKAALENLKEARKLTGTIKKLARQQITIKKDLKGPAKAKKAPKPDSRVTAANPKVGSAFEPVVVGVTGGAVSVAS